MDFLFVAGAGAATVVNYPIVQNVLGNRADRGIDFVVARLARARREEESEFARDLAFGAWWSCLQAGILACTRLIDAAGDGDGRDWETDALRKHLVVELGELERDRGRYFRQRGGLADPSAWRPGEAGQALLHSEALAGRFREWLASELTEMAPGSAGVPEPLEVLLADEAFSKSFEAFLGEAIRADPAVRQAYDSVVLHTLREAVVDLAARPAPPTIEQIGAALRSSAVEVGAELDRRLGEKIDPLERMLRDLAPRLDTSARGVDRMAESLSRHIERRRESERLASIAAGRNAGILVEDRIDDLLAGPFVGRTRAIAELNRRLFEDKSGSILVSAPPGYGKSSLLAHWLRGEGSLWGHVAYHFVDLQRGPDVCTRERMFANLLGQMLPYFGIELDPTKDAEGQVGALLDGHVPARPDEALIVLIDALDEIVDWGPFGPTLLLRDDLPDNVFVVASTRAGMALDAYWSHDHEIGLEVLSSNEISRMIAAHGDGELTDLAGDRELISRLESTTGGVPLYLDFALRVFADEGWNGALATSDEERIGDPYGGRGSLEARFALFLRGHLRHLHAIGPGLTELPEYQLLQLLVAAGTTLHENDLAQLNIDPLALGDMRVMRWIEGPASGFYSLPHRFLGVALAAAFDPALLERARRRLRRLAGDWRSRPSPYAAHNLAGLVREEIRAHAGEAGKRERERELFALGADPGFCALQERFSLADPMLPSRTIATVADFAAERGETLVATELALRGRGLREELESPARAVAAGTPVPRLIGLLEALDADARGTWASYVELAMAAKRATDREAFRAWWQRAQESEPTASWRPLRGTEQTLVGLAGRMGELDLAEGIAQRIRDGRYRAVALAKVALWAARRGGAEEAARLAGLARAEAAVLTPTDLRSPWLVTVSRWCAAAGLDDDMREAAHEACRLAEANPGGRASTYQIAMAAQWAGRIGETEIAIETARRALELSRGDLRDVARAATALALAGEVDEAIAIAIAALADAGGRDWEGRIGAADALAASGALEEARTAAASALDVAREERGEWKMLGLAKVAAALAELGDLDAARKARADAAKVVRGELGVAPAALLRLAGEQADAGEVDEAESALVEARLRVAEATTGDPSLMLDGIVSTLLSLGRREEALAVAEEISLPQIRAAALIEITGELGPRAAPEEILPVLSRALEATHEHFRPGVFAGIADVLAVGGHAEEATLVARAVEGNGRRATALARLVARLARKGDVGRATELAGEALFALRKPDGTSLSAFDAPIEVAEALALCGGAEQALELVREEGRPMGFARVAEALAERGARDLAARTAAEALAAAEEELKPPPPQATPQLYVQSAHPDAAVLLAAARALEGKERLRLARDVWRWEVKEQNANFDEWGPPYFLDEEGGAALALIAAEEGAEAVLALVPEAEHAELRARLLTGAARALAEAGGEVPIAPLVERASELARPLESAARVLAEGAVALAKSGDPATARQLVEEARGCASPEDEALADLISVELAEAALTAGELEDAAAIARDLLAREAKDLGTPPYAQLSARAVEVLGAAGREPFAIGKARSFDDPAGRVRLLTATAMGLAKAGHSARSFRVAFEAIGV